MGTCCLVFLDSMLRWIRYRIYMCVPLQLTLSGFICALNLRVLSRMKSHEDCHITYPHLTFDGRVTCVLPTIINFLDVSEWKFIWSLLERTKLTWICQELPENIGIDIEITFAVSLKKCWASKRNTNLY